jgi:hypothetical protein
VTADDENVDWAEELELRRGRTLVQGWWGLISLVIANPFTIVMNLVALVQARRLPPPQLSSI